MSAIVLKAVARTLGISAPTVLDAFLHRTSMQRCDARLRSWAHKVLRDAEVIVDVDGIEHAGDGSEAFVVMSNHQSLYDIPLLFSVIPGRLRMVAKAELFRVPIWGRAMLESGFVRVERSNRAQAIDSLRAGADLLKQGTRVWIAPEGTRSKTGKLGAFKSGGFHMAIDQNTRILPIVVTGTRNILPAKGFAVRRGQRVHVSFLPPIQPADFPMAPKGDRKRELMDAVRKVMVEKLDAR